MLTLHVDRVKNNILLVAGHLSNYALPNFVGIFCHNDNTLITIDFIHSCSRETHNNFSEK